MKQSIFRFCTSLTLYWIVATYSKHILIVPSEIVSIAIFLPPLIGLMWGPVAAAGACVGGILALPGLFNGTVEITYLIGVAVWIFLAGYLPYFLWHKKNSGLFSLETNNIKKFIIIIVATFAVTSVIRTLTASDSELEAVKGLFELYKKYPAVAYICVRFVNDSLIAIFSDVVLFFVLIGEGFNFYNSPKNADKESITDEEHTTLQTGALCYLTFPVAVIYLDIYQIYGMEEIEMWMTFLIECLLPMDMYIVLIVYLMLHHRNSIMLEILFLVAFAVFLSSLVLGIGSSIAMGNMVSSNVKDSLHEMSVICRERLDRTFFCTRQAVNGMERQALKTLESYDRLKDDDEYREKYLADMESVFESIATRTDGCMAYYLRLAPEIEGTKGGFSFAREDLRWEGTLAPFAKREPIDLALYSHTNFEKVGWYYTPFNSKCATWIEPYIDPIAKTYVISYVAPLFDGENFIGVIGIDIDFNFIIQELRRMSIYNYGYVYLMNRNNLILYHKDQEQGTLFQPNPDFQEMEIYLTNGMWLGIATPLSEVHEERNHILLHLVAVILIVAMLVSLGSLFLVSKMIHLLSGMTDAAKRIASGDLNIKIAYESGNELGILVQSIRDMAAQLEIYVYRDKLTGLFNAAAYAAKNKELDEKIKPVADLAYAVVLFDVNFLKKVNDNYGHQAGNQLICRAANVISRVFANSPVYRVGGDEFVAILEHEDYEDREDLIELFDKEIAKESFEVQGVTINISVARGVGIYEDGMEFSAVSKKADSEMYKHKAAIKSKYGEDVS